MARRPRSHSPVAILAEDAGDESGALHRGLEIMRFISAAHPSVSVDEVVEELNTTKATAQRLLATLVENNFLRASRDPGRYFADVCALTLGRAFLGSVDGLEPLSATLRTFQDIEKVCVTVWVRDRTEGVSLATSSSEELLVGRRYDLDRFCAGHVLMWSADSDVRFALQERFAGVSANRMNGRPATVYRSFHRLETDGFCVSEATPEGTGLCIGFPFHTSKDGVVLAFSLEHLQPGGKFGQQRARELVKSLTEMCSRTYAL